MELLNVLTGLYLRELIVFSLMLDCGLAVNFWAESVSIACYLVNRSPHSSIDYKIPEEIWSGNPIDYSILRVFGFPVFAHINYGKLAPRVVKCMFLSYASESKEYRLSCPNSKKII
jgi:hypothetical protein